MNLELTCKDGKTRSFQVFKQLGKMVMTYNVMKNGVPFGATSYIRKSKPSWASKEDFELIQEFFNEAVKKYNDK